MKRQQKISQWLKTQCEALTPKQQRVLLWVLLVSYTLLTLWVVVEVFVTS